MATYAHYKIQMVDALTREAIITAGGKVYVAADGDAAKVVCYSDSTGTALTIPFTPTRGMIDFWTLDTVAQVDLYAEAPGGQFFTMLNVKPSGPNVVLVDTGSVQHTMVIPFSTDDMTDNTDTDTGFDTGVNKYFLPYPFVRVLTADSGETLDVGTANDADGFIQNLSMTTAGIVRPRHGGSTVVTQTLGALFIVQGSSLTDNDVPQAHVESTSANINMTLDTTTVDTAEGFVYLPYILSNAP